MEAKTNSVTTESTPKLYGWERVAMAIEEIRARLLRVTAALNTAGIPYAVIGGNAVAEWVGRVDDGAVRFTKDVDILLRRQDMPWVKVVLQQAGFFFGESMGVPFFLDSPNAKPSSAVHVIYANETVKPNDAVVTPSVDDIDSGEHFRILSLEKLVQMKLTSFRRKDQVHLLDMLGVGLIDASWPQRFPVTLAARLQELIDNPD